MRQTKQNIAASVYVRWLIRRDMEEVLAIEQHNFDPPWFEETFLHHLRDRHTVAMVAEVKDRDNECGFSVAGFMVYELRKTSLRVLNFCTHPKWRGCGIGSRLIDKLKSKLSPHRRTSLTFTVRETNMDMLLFLKKHGFIATAFFRDHFDAVDDRPSEGCIRMKFWIDAEEDGDE